MSAAGPKGIPLVPPPARIGGDPETPLHVALVEPEIPPNTGNIARLCAGIGAWLHLVEPLGFDLDSRKLHRAGLDYWPGVKLSLHPDFESFAARLALDHTYFFSARTGRSYFEASYRPGDVLVFGRETTGLGAERRERFSDRLVRIPIGSAIRSLNLSNAVAVAAFEALRQTGRWPRTGDEPEGG